MTESTIENKGSFWQELTKSLNPNFYCSILRQTFGRSLRYLILLVLFVAVVLSVKYTIDLRIRVFSVSEWARGNLSQVLSDIPAITIENGDVFCAVPQPFIKRWGAQKDRFDFIIDTTGKIASLEGYEFAMLLTKNKLIFKNTESQGVTEIKEYDLSKVSYFKLQPGEEAKGEIINVAFSKGKMHQLTYKSLARWLKILPWVASPVILIFLFSYYAFAKIIQLFFFSPIAFILAKLTRSGINYPQVLNIGVYALTVPTLLAVLSIIMRWNTAIFGLFYISVYMFFLIAAIFKCKEFLIAQKQLTQ
ncbi:MAG: DUF1189 family protein [Candidatus Omnitrophica bacterium]|nr:DUF1189 family protein [Candidatus Omnitrophota bacterium]MDD5592946.1 DUF1189 family protein [Candidatus Omnitrophota bacterium]